VSHLSFSDTMLLSVDLANFEQTSLRLTEHRLNCVDSDGCLGRHDGQNQSPSGIFYLSTTQTNKSLTRLIPEQIWTQHIFSVTLHKAAQNAFDDPAVWRVSLSCICTDFDIKTKMYQRAKNKPSTWKDFKRYRNSHIHIYILINTH